MVNFTRTHYCGNLRPEHVNQVVSVCGWVAKMRDLGGVIFIDLRDRSGIVQCTFNQEDNSDLFDTAFTVRSEFVVCIEGTLKERREGAQNLNLPTGQVEIAATNIKILSKSQTPPFEITDDINTNDQLRMKYRYLDLRRPCMQNSLSLRHRVTQIARNYFDNNGFLEIETPMLTKSTPEGARDYLVPSRVHPGKFYALPQSPQQYKQLLMVAGFDRYFQIVRCFRDEDLRADRQPEFTQIDLEMSFVDKDEIMAVNEGFIAKVFDEVLGIKINLPLERISYSNAMSRFGSDKPDTRFAFEICDLSYVLSNCSFKVFANTIECGGTVRCINIPGFASKFPRKEIDSLTEFVKTYRAKGLAWLKLSDGSINSSFAKFLSDKELERIKTAADVKDGDILFIVADNDVDTALVALGQLRCEIAKRLDIIDDKKYNLLWVTDFPLLEYDQESGRYFAKHHPFTAPLDEDEHLLENAPQNVRAKAYDIILNGVELGGGSIRIHDNETQSKMFKALGFTHENAVSQFGHLLEAFKYGVPPHGGLAYGLDRLCMLLAGHDSIRDVIAFPKVQNASELMTMCPDIVDNNQLSELSIKIEKKQQ